MSTSFVVHAETGMNALLSPSFSLALLQRNSLYSVPFLCSTSSLSSSSIFCGKRRDEKAVLLRTHNFCYDRVYMCPRNRVRSYFTIPLLKMLLDDASCHYRFPSLIMPTRGSRKRDQPRRWEYKLGRNSHRVLVTRTFFFTEKAIDILDFILFINLIAKPRCAIRE